MKNGTSVLELTMPTRTACAAAGSAEPATTVRHASQGMRRIAKRMVALLQRPPGRPLSHAPFRLQRRAARETFFRIRPPASGRHRREPPMTDAALASPPVTAKDTVPTKGILHFTIGVRDHLSAAKWYSDVLGCKHMRSTERYAFMECGGSYFV